MCRVNERSGGVFSSYNSRKPRNPAHRTIPTKTQQQQQQQQSRWTSATSSSSSSKIHSLTIAKENGTDQIQAMGNTSSSNPLPPPSLTSTTTTTTNNNNNNINSMRMMPTTITTATTTNPSSYTNGMTGVQHEAKGGMDLSADAMILDLITKYVW